MNRKTRYGTASAVLAGITLLTTACAGGAGADGGADAPVPSTAGSGASGHRLVVSYANGVAVLEGASLAPVDEFATEDFVRINDFGDGRTIAVTTSKGFQLLDTAEPELTDVTIDAEAAGHVVPHHGKTVLFDDGTGATTILDTDVFANGYRAPSAEESYVAPKAHHGVSVVLEDGTLLTTLGDETGRTGAVALHSDDGHWDEAARDEQCPGIHGEGTAAHETVVFGCEDGALLYRDGAFVKVPAPDAYGRTGNVYVSDSSSLVVGDYKNDPDAEGYELSAVTLIDADEGTLEVLDLPDGLTYTWRGVARGPEDAAYILATDGSIHVLDPETAQVTAAFPVIDAWRGPAEWQDPHPAIEVDGDIAYVTEPAKNTIHAVDLATGEIITSVEVEYTPNEIAIARG